ncbi:MAG: methyltransferase domain-containing protein [Deltaproteobacteria bacterium]|nr:methyltransferase domain-containing protein [Deltaproteobacteria bacterium]
MNRIFTTTAVIVIVAAAGFISGLGTGGNLMSISQSLNLTPVAPRSAPPITPVRLPDEVLSGDEPTPIATEASLELAAPVQKRPGRHVRYYYREIAQLAHRMSAYADAMLDIPSDVALRRALPASWKSDLDPGYLMFMKRVAELEIRKGSRPDSLYDPDWATRVLPYLPTTDSETTVADVGAGTGAFLVTWMQSGRPFAKAYAVDINEMGLDLMKHVLNAAGFQGRNRVKPVVSRLDDVLLPTDSIDLAVIVNTPIVIGQGQVKSHLAEHPEFNEMRCLASLSQSMRPKGQLHEFAMWTNGDREVPPQVREQLERIYGAAGLKLEKLELVDLADGKRDEDGKLIGMHLHAVYTKPS